MSASIWQRLATLSLLITVAVVWLLAACLPNTTADEALLIRIRNNSGFDVENFWLGAGPNGGATQDTAFGAIPNNTVTSYHSIEPNPNNYRKYNLVIDGRRYLGSLLPDEIAMLADAPVGQYTFVLTLTAGNAQIEIVKDL